MTTRRRGHCIDCGRRIEPGGNPYWCDLCNERRLARIDATMERLGQAGAAGMTLAEYERRCGEGEEVVG